MYNIYRVECKKWISRKVIKVDIGEKWVLINEYKKWISIGEGWFKKLIKLILRKDEF